MKKIISLFQRNYDGNRLVRDEVVPGAEWVLAGEGTPTRKWDGTACLVKDGVLYKRYDAKKGKTPPATFIPAQDPDPVTGHWPGWLPTGMGNEDQYFLEAWLNWQPSDGTYELIGPKVQGNPEHAETHMFVRHGGETLGNANPRTYIAIKHYLQAHDIEGIVWWRDPSDPDCDKVKIKAKDFGIKRGVK